MRVTVWGINYAPEEVGIAPFNTGLCRWLVRRGHEVSMLTSFPYYPSWTKAASDEGVVFRTECIDGVRILRSWLLIPRRVTTLSRIAHEVSFVVSSFCRGIVEDPPDCYVVVSPPLLLGAAAWVLSRLKQRPFLFHVQDLQPDAAIGLGMLRGSLIVDVLYGLERLSYDKATAVSGISSEMLESFLRKGVARTKIFYFPNWLPDEASDRGVPDGNRFRDKWNVPRTAFVACYSGNLGKKQDLSIIIRAAEELEKRIPKLDIEILIVGAGAALEELRTLASSSGVRCVKFLPLLPKEEYHDSLAAIDVALITQAKGSGTFFLPSKLLTVLSHQVPVLAVADSSSGLAKVIEDQRFGVVVEPDRPRELADALEALAANRSSLGEMASRTTWVRQFSQELILQRLELRVAAIANERGIRPLVV